MRIVFRLDPELSGNVDKAELLRKVILSSGLHYARAKQQPRVPRIAYGPSLKRGQRALREYADIYLLTSVPAEEVRAKLEACKPEGLTLLQVSRVPYALAGVAQLASTAVYRVEGNFEDFSPQQTLENYVSSARLEVTCRAANGMCLTKDIKPFVLNAVTLSPQQIELTITRVGEKWISPLEVIYGWLGVENAPAEGMADERFLITRQGLYWQDSQQNLHLI